MLNMLKNKKQVPEEKIIEVLEILKQELNKQEQLLFSDDYDIFLHHKNSAGKAAGAAIKYALLCGKVPHSSVFC